MATIIPNPDNIPGAVTTGYQAQNTVLYAGMVGFLNVNVATNVITAGSVFEINGTLAKVEVDEPIQNIDNFGPDIIFYIYATPVNATTVKINASAVVPIWNINRGGYYDNNGNRALIRATKGNDGTLVPILMNRVLDLLIPDPIGGEVLYANNSKRLEHIWCKPGWIRYEMASGAGAGIAPGNGHGEEGGGCSYSGGGGCGAGEETYIISGSKKITTGIVPPGNGGNCKSEEYPNSILANGGLGLLENICIKTNEVQTLPIGDGPAGDLIYSIDTYTRAHAIGFKGLYGFNLQANENPLVTVNGVSLPQPDGHGGTPGNGYGGGGAAAKEYKNYSIPYATGGIPTNIEYKTGSFFHEGGTIQINIGGNGFNGGAGEFCNAMCASGGGGGAPGWVRNKGDTNSGFCNLWYLGI